MYVIHCEFWANENHSWLFKDGSWVDIFKLEVVSYHTGGDESSSISHAILRFVYSLGQRYNVEMIHALVLDMYAYLSALLKNVFSQR